MTKLSAICIRCGTPKTNPMVACSECVFDPTRGSQEDVSKSIYLSIFRFIAPEDQDEYRGKLAQYALLIRQGIGVEYDTRELLRIQERAGILSAPLRKRDCLKILVFILAFLAIPFIAVMVFILTRR